MGLQQRMMNMMMGRKSPEDTRRMMGEMMPQMMGNMDPAEMAKMMPQMMDKMGHEEIEGMMLNMMPQMMDTCFSGMDKAQREFMLTHCRGMLDAMEAKYVSPSQPV